MRYRIGRGAGGSPLPVRLREAEAALKKARENLEMLSNTVLGGTARLAPDDGWRIVTASEGYYRMIGYTRQELQEPPFCGRVSGIVLPEDAWQVARAVEEIGRTGKPGSASFRCRKKDGAIVWHRAFCSRIDDSSGERLVDVFYMDTTDERKREQQLSFLLNGIPRSRSCQSGQDHFDSLRKRRVLPTARLYPGRVFGRKDTERLFDGHSPG